jgi:hypothetical protein
LAGKKSVEDKSEVTPAGRKKISPPPSEPAKIKKVEKPDEEKSPAEVKEKSHSSKDAVKIPEITKSTTSVKKEKDLPPRIQLRTRKDLGKKGSNWIPLSH